MQAAKQKVSVRMNNDIRELMLLYFYDRNNSATSERGKKGSAVKISDIKADLKAMHNLTQPEVQSNLTYLISQGWVEKEEVVKEIRGPRGTTFPSATPFYKITAPGIDKIEGPGEFTMEKFHGIKIEATGQNIITVGDGNRVDSRYEALGESLAELNKLITNSVESDADKLNYVADIDTIQSQLAKPEPNRTIIGATWQSVKGAAAINGCSTLIFRIGDLIKGFLAPEHF